MGDYGSWSLFSAELVSQYLSFFTATAIVANQSLPSRAFLVARFVNVCLLGCGKYLYSLVNRGVMLAVFIHGFSLYYGCSVDGLSLVIHVY